MSDLQEINVLYRVARMYYEQDMTQSEIAKELSVNRTSISRMLKKIREQGIVQIRINYDAFRDVAVAEKLKARYNLKDVILVPTKRAESKPHRLMAMGQACASYLNEIINEQDVVGFSWGSSLAAVAEAWHPTKGLDITCVPLIGGPDGKLASRYYANTIVYEVARKTNGQSKLIDFPAFASSLERLARLTIFRIVSEATLRCATACSSSWKKSSSSSPSGTASPSSMTPSSACRVSSSSW